MSGDNITFSWLLSRDVTLSSGVVKYSLCAKKLNGDSISNEWNTTIANGVVIQGLEATQAIVEENPDIIEAILSKAHTHANKSVLDKFAETNGKPTYDGKALGGGASTSEGVSYTNAQLPNAANVKTALDELVPKSHSHANKDALDKISVSNGKLQYNGSNVGLKGDKGTDGTTPHIGDNGNWYLGTTDTGKPSRGAKGDPGKNGNDASVTEANITSALGYKPVAPGDIPVVPTAEISANTSARHSHTNKDVLDSITAIDTVMSGTSTNPVQNKAVKAALDGKLDKTGGTLTGNLRVTGALFSGDGLSFGTGENIHFTKAADDAGKLAHGAAGVDDTVPLARLKVASPTEDDDAATKAYVDKIASSGGGGSSSNILTSPVMICKPGEEGSAGIYLSTVDTGEKQAEIKLEDANENSAVAIANLRTPTGANASDYAATKGYVDNKVPTALKNPNALTIKIGSTTVTYDGSTAQTVTIADGSEVSY